MLNSPTDPVDEFLLSRQNNWAIHKACDSRLEPHPGTMTNKKLIRK